jgi:hypothetical protein
MRDILPAIGGAVGILIGFALAHVVILTYNWLMFRHQRKLRRRALAKEQEARLSAPTHTHSGPMVTWR